MRTSHLALLLAMSLAPAGVVSAQQASPGASVKPPADKTPESDRLRLEFSDTHRMITAFYPNDSQARIKVYAANRYDGETARQRETFMLELSGAGIADQVRFDTDDSASIDRLISILERFKNQAEKSGKLKASMEKRKTDADAALSREETNLVELKSAANPDAAAIEKSSRRIEDLKAGVAMADEIKNMPSISGVLGKAKLNADRPEYEFLASFEPEKALFTLKAGYSFRVSAGDTKFLIDLLKRTQEFKARLLENEAKDRKVRAEIDGIFASKAE